VESGAGQNPGDRALTSTFLSRDGRIRTGDLSVPKAGRGVCGGLGWTKAQVRALSKLL